jgi:hypothetical protein
MQHGARSKGQGFVGDLLGQDVLKQICEFRFGRVHGRQVQLAQGIEVSSNPFLVAKLIVNSP